MPITFELVMAYWGKSCNLQFKTFSFHQKPMPDESALAIVAARIADGAREARLTPICVMAIPFAETSIAIPDYGLFNVTVTDTIDKRLVWVSEDTTDKEKAAMHEAFISYRTKV